MRRVLQGAFLTAMLAATASVPRANAQGKTRTAKPPKADLTPAQDSAQRLAEKEKKRAREARKANTRALFADTDPLEFTLIANFDAISKDRDTLSTKRFAGTIVVADSAGEERRIPVKLRTRGHFRLTTSLCRFVPIRIDFPDSGRKNTPFAGQAGVKLGTHCQNNDDRYDSYTRREYLAYRVFNQITDRSFRARIARGTYVDSASGRTVATRTAMFIENEAELGRRLGARIREELRGALFGDLEQEQLLSVMLFEYAIGNTDYSIYALHNMRIAQTRTGVAIPLAYDFDFSGLVDAHYATPPPQLRMRNVRERRFRGPCHPADIYQRAAARFIERKSAVLAQIDSVPGFTRNDTAWAREYLTEFYQILESPARFKREVVDQCERKEGV